MGIAQIALDLTTTPPLSNGQTWKKMPQTILASSPDIPGQTWGKKCPKHILASLYTPSPLTGNAHMETTHFKKGLPYDLIYVINQHLIPLPFFS